MSVSRLVRSCKLSATTGGIFLQFHVRTQQRAHLKFVSLFDISQLLQCGCVFCCSWQYEMYNDVSLCHMTKTLFYIYKYIYRMSQEECARLREGVPYAKLYRYNPKHLSPKWNCYGDNGQRKVWSSCGSTNCNCRLTLSPPSYLNLVSHDMQSPGSWAVNFTA